MTQLGIHMQRLGVIAFVGLTAFVQGCTGMRSDYDTPRVTISSFRAAPAEGTIPKFLIGLHVVNPNREPLKLEGIAYTISLEGRELMTGVSRDLPVIEGYGEGDFTITATLSLIESLRLVGDLMRTHKDRLRYDLKAKLDIGALQPAIRIKDSGELSLRPSGNTHN